MKLVLSHETALSHLRAHREHGRDSLKPARIRTLDDFFFWLPPER